MRHRFPTTVVVALVLEMTDNKSTLSVIAFHDLIASSLGHTSEPIDLASLERIHSEPEVGIKCTLLIGIWTD